MADIRSVTLDGDARDEFFGRGGTGVVSFARSADEAPYTVPVSYGYDAEEETFYFRLSVDSEREKAVFVDRRSPVSFAVYDTADGEWHSVVATGRLEEVTEAAIDSEAVEAMRRVEILLVDVFDHHPRTVEFGFFRLAPDELTGRREAHRGLRGNWRTTRSRSSYRSDRRLRRSRRLRPSRTDCQTVIRAATVWTTTTASKRLPIVAGQTSAEARYPCGASAYR
jgi:nitroimidazol reductase NimA-like FMN-containing flavoprotein (pyridoxamine 5'-phosphate oxidase superfamily)